MTEEQFIKISFGDAFRFLLRGILPALVVAGAAGAVAFFVSRNPEPLYRSTALLLATRPAAGYSNSNIIEPTQVDPAIYRSAVVEGGLLEAALANVYGEEPTAEMSAEWRRNITIRVDENLISGLVRIQVNNENPDLAKEVASALADLLLAWDRDRVGRNIQVTAASLSRSVSLLGAQIAAAEQAGDSEAVQVLSDTRDQRLAQLRSADALRLSAVVVGLLEPFRSAAADPELVNDRTTFVTGIAFALFFILSYIVMFFIRVSDPRIRTVEDLANAAGREPLASIPSDARRPEFGEAIGRVSLGLHWASSPDRVLSADSRAGGQVVAVTSSTSISERSLSSRLLAGAYARAGWRVLLVDADLKEGYISSSMPAARRVGTLVELLRSTEFVDPESVANGSGVELDFIPAGPVPVDGATILLMRRIPWLINQWRAKYDIVVIDSTALARSAGTLAMARDVDAVLLVARLYETRLRAVQTAVKELETGGAKSIDTALLMGAAGRRSSTLASGKMAASNRFALQASEQSHSARAKVVQRSRR